MTSHHTLIRVASDVRPFMWSVSIQKGWTALPLPDTQAADCKFALTIEELPTVVPGALPPPLPKMTICHELRKCNLQCAPTDAKMSGLYPHYAKMQKWANVRGFQKVLGLDMNGNVSETESANVFMVRAGVVYTPVANGTFLDGITRWRVMCLLRAAGVSVVETTLTPADFAAADEVFTTGNIGKVRRHSPRYTMRGHIPPPLAPPLAPRSICCAFLAHFRSLAGWWHRLARWAQPLPRRRRRPDHTQSQGAL